LLEHLENADDNEDVVVLRGKPSCARTTCPGRPSVGRGLVRTSEV
jgi:hypothetical protein